MDETKNTPPAKTIRYGRIEAAIWKRQGEQGPWYSVTLSRSYKDADDQWQRSDNLSRDDLLTAAKALDQAHSWIVAREHEERDQNRAA